MTAESGGGPERCGNESGEPRPSLDAIRGEEVEGGAAEASVAVDLAGEARGGGARRRCPRRARRGVAGGGEGLGDLWQFYEKEPAVLRNCKQVPSGGFSVKGVEFSGSRVSPCKKLQRGVRLTCGPTAYCSTL